MYSVKIIWNDNTGFPELLFKDIGVDRYRLGGRIFPGKLFDSCSPVGSELVGQVILNQGGDNRAGHSPFIVRLDRHRRVADDLFYAWRSRGNDRDIARHRL